MPSHAVHSTKNHIFVRFWPFSELINAPHDTVSYECLNRVHSKPKIMNIFTIKSTTDSRSWIQLLNTHTNTLSIYILNRISSLLDLRFEASVLFELLNVVMIILITSKLDELVVSLFDIYPLQIFAFLPFYLDADRKRKKKNI